MCLYLEQSTYDPLNVPSHNTNRNVQKNNEIRQLWGEDDQMNRPRNKQDRLSQIISDKQITKKVRYNIFE